MPLKISGVEQNFRVYEVSLIYSDKVGGRSNSLVYKLERSAAKVDFNGSLDLGLLGMVVDKAGEYWAKLSGEYLFK